MIKKLVNYLYDIKDLPRVAVALSKAAVAIQSRTVDLTSPQTWEFSGFSQNGEDGILEVLRKQLKEHNRYFIEIGVADGLENNTAWLAIAEKYSGIMIEGNKSYAMRADRMVKRYSIGAECRNMFVTVENIQELKSISLYDNPDVFSLDIDGNDFYIAKAIINSGFRPKIFAVEYNSAFGPQRSLTVKYRDDFVFTTAHPTKLYYGVSIAGWKKFFEEQGYKFITVDRNGVNAFFIDPKHFKDEFIANIHGTQFAENQYQLYKFRSTFEEQFKLISDQTFEFI
jgi:hypothetical protein